MKKFFDENWFLSVPLAYSELFNGEGSMKQERIDVTCDILGFSSDPDKFRSQYRLFQNIEKQKLMKRWSIKPPIRGEIISMVDSLLLSDTSLLRRINDAYSLVDAFGEQIDDIERLETTVRSLVKYQPEFYTCALIYILMLKRNDNSLVWDPYNHKRVFNGYSDLKFIAGGSYGRVYRVNKDGVAYADKTVSKLDINEINILRTFDHPNILKAVDFFYDEANNISHIILPLADNTLTSSINSDTPLDTRISWIYQILSAVHFFHKQGYYHCDLKPDNILIMNGNPLIADFGISYPIGTKMDFCGTPGWTSPESIRNKGVMDEYHRPIIHKSSDIFSLGCIIVYIMTGEKLLDLYKISAMSDDEPSILTYDHFISNYKTILKQPEFSNLDDTGIMDLIYHMCYPDVKNRIKTIDEVLTYNIFKRSNMQIPVPGSMIDMKNIECSLEIQKDMILGVLNIATHQNQPIILAYLTVINVNRVHTILPSIDVKDIFVSCYEISCLMFKLDSNISWDILYEKVSSNRTKISEVLVKDIPYLLQGKIRHQCLFDVALSYQECLYGLACLLSCRKFTVDEQHLHFISRETNDMLLSRRNKNTTYLDTKDYSHDFISLIIQGFANSEKLFPVEKFVW